jgi:hypothetical protein
MASHVVTVIFLFYINLLALGAGLCDDSRDTF